MVNGFNSDAMKGWGNNTLRAGVDGWYPDGAARAAYGVQTYLMEELRNRR